MTPEFIIFLLSFLAIVFLICHKMYEQKTGTSVLFSDVREKGDAIVHRAVSKVRSHIPKVNVDREHLKSNARLIGAFARRFWNTFRTFLRERYAEFEHAMKRQATQQEKDAASSSYFLRSIAKPGTDEIHEGTVEAAVAHEVK